MKNRTKPMLKKCFSLLIVGLAFFTFSIGAANALEVNLDVSSDSSTDLESECEGIDSGFAGALGCSQTDQVTDFTTYDGEFEGPDATGYDDSLTQTDNARDFIQQIVNFALTFLGLISVVVIIYGGVLYVVSRGDEEMATKGKKSITYAAVGIIIIFFAFPITNTLIEGGGGGSSNSSLGTGNNGETITDAGADFDVDTVLAEIEDVTNEFIDVYDTFISVQADIDYMQGLAVPFGVDLEVTEKGLDGAFEALDNFFSQEGFHSTTMGLYFDQAWSNEYVNEIRSESQDIQNAVDSLSDTFEQATEIYNYLRSGLDNDTEANKQVFLASIVPSAGAVDVTNEVLNALSELENPGSCANFNSDEFELRSGNAEYAGYYTNVGTHIEAEGLIENWSWGDDEYKYKLVVLDYSICEKLEELEAFAQSDYEEQVQDLIDQFIQLEALFDTEDVKTTGSKLGDISQLITNVANSGLTDDCADLAGSLRRAKCTITASTVRDVVEDMGALYAEVQNIDFVGVVMTASATEGNAPLIVNFDVLGSLDPSGQTIQDNQIYWDAFGTDSFTDVYLGETKDPNDSSTRLGDLVGETQNQLIGDTTSIRFDEPGTYQVRVRISSQDEDIAAGIATLTIEVAAPRSKMVLTALAGNDADPTVLADYTMPEELPIRIDRDSFKVTESEAEDGITFDASASTDGEGNDLGIVYFIWDFGDGETFEGTRSEAATPVPHAYGEPGTYNASLTISDATGVEDRKYFNIIVGSPAARILHTPTSGEVGTIFEFDGSASTADVGTIVSYRWSADSELELSQTSGSSITAEAEEPGIFDVTLSITDSEGATDSVSAKVIVESQVPVPYYEWEVPSTYQPATVVFDATESYDPDEQDDLEFKWDFDGEEDEDYIILDGDDDEANVTVQFLSVDEYEVAVEVCDDHSADLQKCAEMTKTVPIELILDVDLEIEGENARHLDDNGESEVEFIAYSEIGESIEFDFGDGETSFADNLTSGQAVVSHTYTSAGVFYVTATALDEEDNTNSITRRVFVGTGDSPIAVLDVSISGVDIGSEEPFQGDVTKTWTFDASESLNMDGTTNDLDYSWNFGDGTVSTLPSVTHRFDEDALYTVTLTVSDEDDPTAKDEATVQIEITGLDPEIRGLTVTPAEDTLITPTKVNLSVDAIDEDGEINYVKFWYVDADNTATEQGVVISQTTSASMTINTNGEEGDERDVLFYAEVVDNDDNSVYSFDEIDTPSLTVTNGENENPVSTFSVDRTSVFVGEEVVFSSESYDPDGDIATYEWDIEGNGYFDNDAVENSSLTYSYSQIHTDGIDVGLRVTDNSGATDTSTLTIYVDSLANPPTAKFLSDVEGTAITITDNSDIDTENGAEFQGFYCDANLNADADGDGNSENDIEYVLTSQGGSFTHDYGELGTYNVTCTVTDTGGQVDSVSQTISVIETADPVANFTYAVDDKEVQFENLSEVDEELGVEVRSYIWDFDTESDEDESSSRKNPDFTYEDYGFYEVELSIEDSFGKTDSYTMTIEVPSPIEPLEAVLTAVPTPNELGQIILDGTEDDVTFFYSVEGGSGNITYEFDKNIFYDTEGDGVRENDVDYDDDGPGSWKTTFFESYGEIVVKLTAIDEETGDEDVQTIQVVFEGNLGSANLFNATTGEMLFLIISAMLAAILGVSMTFRYKPIPR